ncbi:MAG: hypothetical protein WBE18_00430 [Gammaproteobacteria bacterium]
METRVQTNIKSIIDEIALGDINPILLESDVPDAKTHLTAEYLEKNQQAFLDAKLESYKTRNHKIKIYNDTLIIYNESLQMEQKWRAIYGRSLPIGVGGYLVIVLLIVMFQRLIRVDDKVVMMLLGTTSINIIGLLAIVIRFLFSGNHHKIMDSYQDSQRE